MNKSDLYLTVKPVSSSSPKKINKRQNRAYLLTEDATDKGSAARKPRLPEAAISMTMNTSRPPSDQLMPM